MNPESILLSNLALIERIATTVCRRWLFDPDDVADFVACVKAALIEDDYAVLRKFEGRSSLSTYLTVVITNFMRDYRVRRWGRWRPSVEAKRLGRIAIRLEALVYRDGCSLHQAIATVRSAGVTDLSDRELANLVSRMPNRQRHRNVPDTAVLAVTSDAGADRELLLAERDGSWRETRAELEGALATLSAEDQLILRLRYWEGFSIADIARALKLEQKPLYRRIERQLVELRRSLTSRGVDKSQVGSFLNDEWDA